jgi:hypothetical protein
VALHTSATIHHKQRATQSKVTKTKTKKEGRNERKKSEGMKNTNQLGAVSCVCVCDFFGRLNKSFIQKGRRQKANPGKKRKRK